MKKFKYLFCIALFAMALNANAQQKGVTINGVTWATTNVGATSPEGYGNYYTWEQAQTACPKGWRLPIKDELMAQLDKKKIIREWRTLNGINGWYLTDLATGNNVFLPAAGRSSSSGSSIHSVGKDSVYWSSTEYSGNCLYGGGCAYGLAIDPLYVYLGIVDKLNGCSVRCVAE